MATPHEPAQRSREQLVIDVLAVCVDMVSRGIHPSPGRIVARVGIDERLAKEIRDELERHKLINLSSNYKESQRRIACSGTESERAAVEAAKLAIREANAKRYATMSEVKGQHPRSEPRVYHEARFGIGSKSRLNPKRKTL